LVRSETAIVAAFEDRIAAEHAVDELEQSGFSTDEVGMAIRGTDSEQKGMISDAEGTKDGRGAAAGMITGAGLGAILGAAAAFLIPGVGPVMAAGILSAAFGGAIAGAAVGGIFGALTGLGISEHEAKYYEQAFNSGHAIVAVKAGDRCNMAAEILRKHGGYDLQNRADDPVKTEGPFSTP
jgi:hypothetical protein